MNDYLSKIMNAKLNWSRLSDKSLKPIFLKIFVSLFFLGSGYNVFAQKQLAITIDDPNTIETPMFSAQERDHSILQTLEKHRIKAALFVCGMRVNDVNGEELLKNWDTRNHLICNHSYSHLYYPLKSSEIFIADFFKGDSLIRKYHNYCKMFRFPYLKEGNTTAKIDSMRIVLSNEGYRNGHVTIDASDWYINAQITKLLKEDINADLAPYKEYYIKHILERADYYDSLARIIFKKDIKHTLLIHHSLLNALFLDDLLIALKADGWELIDAKKAFKAISKIKQPNIEPCGESLIWQCAKQNDTIAKSLRYPGEDSQYEEAPLESYLEEYRKRKARE